MYAKKYSIATNLMLNRMSPNLSRQVRSILTDEYGGLWFGTKGDGLLHLPDYHEAAGNPLWRAMVYSPGEKQVMSSLNGIMSFTFINWPKVAIWMASG